MEALTKTHDGVMGQLKEANDRTSLAEQETIEVTPAYCSVMHIRRPMLWVFLSCLLYVFFCYTDKHLSIKLSMLGSCVIWLKHFEGTFQGRRAIWSMPKIATELLSSKGAPNAAPSLQAAMKVAECRREMAVAAQLGREPVLASQTQTGSELGEYGL